jgi:hypothetical protein
MTDRDCARIFAMLSEYIDRELPEGSCGELEAHFQDCPECIRFIDSLKRSVNLCHRFGAEQPQEPISPEALAGLRSAYDRMLARRRARSSG